MKKFYLAVGFFVFSFFAGITSIYAQYAANEIFEIDPAGPCATSCNISTPGIWLPPNTPSSVNPCDHCKLILHGNITIDVSVVLDNNGLVVISPNTTVTVQQYVRVLNFTTIEVHSNSSLIVNDEMDLFTGSTIQVAPGGMIDASNPSDFAPHGPHGNQPFVAGIYYVNGAINSTDDFLLVGRLGYGIVPDLVDAVDPPGAPADQSFTYYNLNCPLPPPIIPGVSCLPGFLFGPAHNQFDAVHNIYSFAGGTSLPVELVKFAASYNSNQTVDVSWATAQEVNASNFEVQRSGDVNGGWEVLGSVKAKGFSSITTNYSFTDQNPLTGTSYYRLKMIDQDGKFEYSKIATLSSGEKGESLVIYNNPFSDMIRLKINTNNTDNLTITVTDLLGKLYLTQYLKAKSGDNFVNINPGGASGLYILHIQGRGYDRIVKLIKQ